MLFLCLLNVTRIAHLFFIGQASIINYKEELMDNQKSTLPIVIIIITGVLLAAIFYVVKGRQTSTTPPLPSATTNATSSPLPTPTAAGTSFGISPK
jgi:hypothetical protein